jgi:hypothetical protein
MFTQNLLTRVVGRMNFRSPSQTGATMLPGRRQNAFTQHAGMAALSKI